MAEERAKKSFGPKVILILRTLYHLNRDQRKALLKTADKNIVRAICECALNVLHGVVYLSKQQKSKLAKFKNVLRKLVSVKNRRRLKNNWKSKKRLIIQKSEDLLPVLLGPLISTLLSQLFNKKKQ